MTSRFPSGDASRSPDNLPFEAIALCCRFFYPTVKAIGFPILISQFV
ncbi:hypothetical protein [Oxynema aestuarii]|uniref:Uncharacterized protein n=1 Tax=Oxynema aestuarii AP17 TaxID=2064643 RepID=A0A6H1TXZ7_9CYAN|nr:hypothetical protein [Oxynema aestuarii]QIZ71275.1 hypothetical protein HCG48_12340 [Oxynema aestuarii AP17]